MTIEEYMDTRKFNKEDGHSKGFQAAYQEIRAEAAINLLQENLKIPLISEVTGLPEKEIRELKSAAVSEMAGRPEKESRELKGADGPLPKKKTQNTQKNIWMEFWMDGWSEGWSKSERETLLEIAFKMIQKKMEISLVYKLTRLPEKEISRMKSFACPLPKKEGAEEAEQDIWDSSIKREIWERGFLKGYLEGWRETRKKARQRAWQNELKMRKARESGESI